MHTELLAGLKQDAAAVAAAGEIGKCVHCGFCLPACPTYRLLGDELDSPRGRIYLIKQVLEGATPTATTRLHLDRCLTCRACETACPSGVDYHQVLEAGRALVDQHAPRPWLQESWRKSIAAVVSRRSLFGVAVALGRALRWLLPVGMQRQLEGSASSRPARQGQQRKVILLQGCAQPALRPGINRATARVLGAIGIEALEPAAAGCCGALQLHSGAPDAARDSMRRLVDAWWPSVEAGAEAIIATASGCGVQLADYGRLLADDPVYAEKAARISALAVDIAPFLQRESQALAQAVTVKITRRVAFQSPCTLQHGLRVNGVVESLLQVCGYELLPVADSGLCCGSAGSYSIVQPTLARELRRRKLLALGSGQPDVIATANIGCLLHLAAGTDVPICHWIELVEAAVVAPPRA